MKGAAQVAILGVPDKEMRQLNIFAFTSILASRQILLHLKSNTPPTATQWLKDAMLFLDLKQIKSTRGSNKCGAPAKLSALWIKGMNSLIRAAPQNCQDMEI